MVNNFVSKCEHHSVKQPLYLEFQISNVDYGLNHSLCFKKLKSLKVPYEWNIHS